MIYCGIKNISYLGLKLAQKLFPDICGLLLASSSKINDDYVDTIFNNTKQTVLDWIESSETLSTSSKLYFVDQIKQLDRWKIEDVCLSTMHENISLSATCDSLENYLKLKNSLWNLTNSRDKLHSTILLGTFSNLSVHCCYNPEFNKLFIPIGLTKKPFFDSSHPLESQIATLGTIIAHEMVHAIDDTNERLFYFYSYFLFYSNQQNIRSIFLEDTKLNEFFKLIVTQGDRIEVCGVHAKGLWIVKETLADIIGLQLSCATFERLHHEGTNGLDVGDNMWNKFFLYW